MTTTFPRDEIVFAVISNLTTCSGATIEWMYNRPDPPSSNYPLVVTNIGVDQGTPLRREYPLVSRQGTTAVNKTLININAAMQRANWTQVNVPQGWYRLDFYASTKVLSSNVFAVTNGPDVSCLVAPSQTPSSTPPPPSSTSTGSPSDTSPTSVPVRSSVNTGAIAGGVVGGVGLLALIAALVLCVFHRRNSRSRNATPTGSMNRTKGQGSKGFHNPSDSTGAILPNSPHMSDADFDPEKSAVAYDHTKPSLTIMAPTRAYSESSTSSKRPASMTVQPCFESREMAHPRPPRVPRHSLDGSLVPPHKTAIPPSPSSLASPRYPSDRARRASRKPVPAYDESEFSSIISNDIPLAGRSETSIGTKVYYITPDVPLDQRN